MARVHTHKPCPGCGLNKPLPPQTVCRECREAILDHPKLKAYAELAQGGRALEFDHRVLPVSIRDYPGADRFFEAFLDLLGEVCPPAPPEARAEQPNWRWHEGLSSHCGVIEPPRRFFVAGPRAVAAVSRFLYTINGLIASAKAEGQLRGQDFLGQLAAGEMSMADLNQATADATRNLHED